MLTGERPAGTDLPSDLNKNVPRHLDEAFGAFSQFASGESRFASADEFAKAIAIPTPPPIPNIPPISAPPHLQPLRPPVHGATCPACRRPIEANDQFCMHCGVQIANKVLRCPKCGAWPDPTDRYCMRCGETLNATVV